MGEGHYVLMAYVDEWVHNVPDSLPHPASGTRVVGAVVQEVQDGRVVFDWDSAEHPELYALSTEGNDFNDPTKAADYAHINSFALNPATGNWVLSLRHLDSVLEVSRLDGTIVWRLGADDSFGTPQALRPSHQHYAAFLPDGRLRLYDNGNALQRSRVVTYGLDPEHGRLTSFESLELGVFSRAMGSVQTFAVPGGERVLVGTGAHEDGEPDVLELDSKTGRRTFELTFDNRLYSYRAQKYQ